MKHTTKQIREAIRFWNRELTRLVNEDMEDFDAEHIGELGEQTGREFGGFLTNDIIGRIKKELNYSTISDNIKNAIISHIPTERKNRLFEFMSDEDLRNIRAEIDAGINSDSIDPDGADWIGDAFARGRAALTDEILKQLITESTYIESYDNSNDYVFNSYSSYNCFESPFEGYVSEGALSKFITFCLYFCLGYADVLIDKLKKLVGKYTVTVKWLVPELRDELVDAQSEVEAEDIILRKYAQVSERNPDMEDVFDGVYSVEKA